MPGTLDNGLSVETLRSQYLDWERTSDDPWLLRVLEAATLYAEQITGLKLEPLGTTDEPVTLDVRVLSSGLVPVPQVQDVATVTVGEVPVLEWEVVGARGSFLRIAVTGRRPLRALVTGRFGLVPLPADLEDAIYLLAARRVHEREGGYSDQADVGDGDGEVRFGPLPPQVMTTFRAHKAPRPVTL